LRDDIKNVVCAVQWITSYSILDVIMNILMQAKLHSGSLLLLNTDIAIGSFK